MCQRRAKCVDTNIIVCKRYVFLFFFVMEEKVALRESNKRLVASTDQLKCFTVYQRQAKRVDTHIMVWEGDDFFFFWWKRIIEKRK